MHLAIIMDGNGRYGKMKFNSRSLGHRSGAKKLASVCRWCDKLNVNYLTVYAFSTENWKRDKSEVDFLMNLFKEMFKKYIKESKKNNVKINVIGDNSVFDDSFKKLMFEAMESTKDNSGLVLTIALNYGGRNSIVRAVNKVIESNVNLVNEDLFNSFLETSDLPDIDLVIRTGGESRISNFLLWEIAYSELYFSDVLWPEFSYKDLVDALDYFNSRERRFGGVKKN